MKRKLFFFMMALLPVVAWADDGDQFMVDSLWYRVTSESLKTVELEGYGMGDVPTGHFDGVPRVGEAPTGDFVIPTTVNGYSVTGIGNFALYECSDLTSVIIPETVTSIGDFAFADCTSLTSVNFAEGSQLRCIGDDAFYQCTSLTSITFPPTIIYLNHTAFLGCSNLVSINLEANNIHLMSADGVLFANGTDGVLFNSDRISITIYPEGRTETSYTIPKGVEGIFPYAFNCNTSLISVTIPNSVDGISKYAFMGCYNLSDIYCYADPATLFWAADTSEFKPNKQTLCHVKADRLEAYKEKFGNVNVTFVGDLADGIETLTANSVKGNAVYNLAGQRIGGMAKGLNIVDGRKVMVK